MKGGEYCTSCIKPTFISGLKRIKIWETVHYRKKSKLVIITRDLKKNHKFNVDAYPNEVLDKFFDLWMEDMEDCKHVYVIEHGALSHQGVVS
jgi:hypothetical protein